MGYLIMYIPKMRIVLYCYFFITAPLGGSILMNMIKPDFKEMRHEVGYLMVYV